MRRSLRLVAVFVGLIALAVTLHAAASYPSATKSFTTKLAGAVIASSHVNEIQDEIVAIENGLRTGLAHNLLPDANNTRDLGASGTKWANVYTTALNVNGATLQGPVIQTTTSTGTVNDFALTTGANVLRCNNATALTITGFSPGTDGQRLIVVSIGAGQVDLSHQAGGSSVADRLINFATSGATSLAAGSGFAEYEYDLTTARWRLVQHEQGAWITATYAGGNFTAVGGGTWTVESGDVSSCGYYLRGRTLTLAAQIVTTSVAGTVTLLNILNGAWGGFTVGPKVTPGWSMNNDNAAGNAVGYSSASAADTKVQIGKLVGNYTASVNLTHIFVNVVFEVQ